MHQLKERDRIQQLILKAFPALPVPIRIVREAAPHDEIAAELEETFTSKAWSTLKMADWRGTGIGIHVIGSYFAPGVLAYFLPSLMIAALDEGDMDYALDALAPPNQKREPRGDRWAQFLEGFDHAQRSAVTEFLHHVRNSSTDDSSEHIAAALILNAGWYRG